MKRWWIVVLILAVTAAVAQGELGTAEEAALEAAGGEELGGSVSVLGVWGGGEQETFLEMVRPFEEATGIDVEYTGTRDLNAVLFTRVEGGNPPDLAGLPGPGQMAQFARSGDLVDLGEVLDMDAFGDQYAETWAELGSVDGTLSGIFIKASVKGLIWYNTNVWETEGFEPPQTWDELMTLSQQIIEADSGARPWCVAVESGAASGWPGTDWIEDFVLRQAGPEAYDNWYQGELTWTSDEIRGAWESWGEIVGDPRMVYGGAATMLTTNFGQGGNPLFTDPPGCYMFHQASFITDFFVESFPGLQPVEDFNFFPFPKMSEGAPESVEMAGDLFGMFNDTPQARALVRYLTSAEAQAIWVERGGAISPNQQVPLDLYPDPLARQSAELLTSAEVVRFDASDLMPEAMNNAFWQAILEFIQNPDGLDNILSNLDRVQQDAYAE
ncbi:MAG: extracellular solute-binding protein [Trueperaceae bacterium]